MKLFALVILAAALALCGCQTVPRSMFSYNPSTRTVGVESPKDTEIRGLHIEIKPDGTALIDVEYFMSKNNFDVVAAIAESNAKISADATAKAKDVLLEAIGAAK
jgi:hypothetical protein